MSMGFREFCKLFESLDSPFTLTHLPDNIARDSSGNEIGKFGEDDDRNDITGRKVYSAGDSGWFSTFHRKGAVEIHHFDSSGRSDGVFANKAPNPRFVSTAFHLAKSELASGNSIRIVGRSGDGINKYHSLATIALRRLGVLHTISDPVPATVDGYHEFTIAPNSRSTS